MPCVPLFWMRLIAVPNGGGNYKPRNFTNIDVGQNKVVGKDVNATSIHQFRIQAWNDNYDRINCNKPSFKGEITYFPYNDPPNCDKAEIISIAGTIGGAVVGAGGGIVGTLIAQRYSRAKTI
jgi:hypothetical protein